MGGLLGLCGKLADGQPLTNDDDAVAGQVYVELQAVRTERQTALEGRCCILRRERAAASMREDQRPASREERM